MGWVSQLFYLPVKSIFNSHQRKLLIFLIVLLALFSVALAIFSLFLANLFYVKDEPSSVLTWIGLSFVGLGLMVVCVVGLRGAYYVNIELLLGFFWAIMVFLAPLALGAITCFDLYQYLGIFFRHMWDSAGFDGLRRIFCSSSTYDTTCAAPNGDKAFIDNWCLQNLNSTDCYDIREKAITNAISWSSSLTLIQGIVSVAILFIILVTIYLCFRILTKAVVTESMNDVINYLLVLPMGACAGMAYYMWDWQEFTGLPYFWSAKLFMSAAISQFITLPVGIYAGRLKSQKMLTGYIFLILSIMTGLTIVGTYGLLYAQLIPVTFTPSTVETSFIACKKGMKDCCCCGTNYTEIYLNNITSNRNLCPEWSQSDVISLLVLDLRIAGTVGLVCIMYLIGALIVASVVNYSLRNYKSDFI